MSHYIDEHGAKVDYNPRLRGGPGSVGEALFRTCLIETLLAIEGDLKRIADEQIPPLTELFEREDDFTKPEDMIHYVDR